MAWKLDPRSVTNSEHVVAEWQRAIAEKDNTEARQWTESATQLRSIAATLRDALLPMSPHHVSMVEVVEAISKHLPERRGERRRD